MKRINCWIAVLFLVGAALTLHGGEASSLLLTIEGRVEVALSGAGAWKPGVTNQVLASGDRVRTGARSRATIRLSDRSVLRVNELTTLEIRPASSKAAASFEQRSGSSYFFNHERPADVQFRTPLASGAIRGTEFNLVVAENGRTELTLVDGAVDLSNELGAVSLASGDGAVVDPGEAPRKTAVLDAMAAMQWALYYPAIVDADAELNADEKSALADSLAAYRSGDLLTALAKYPEGRQPASDAEKVYRAATLLAVGQVAQATQALQQVSTQSAHALRQLVETVRGRPYSAGAPVPNFTATHMAESYALQAKGNLTDALKHARTATELSPNFGFAWARVAKLEFSFGRGDAALKAVERSLAVSPRNAEALALRGFILAGQNKLSAATKSFDDAIAIDPALGNAWLGRGLVKIRRGDVNEGREDVQTAATLEPQRALTRTYLGKAWNESWDAQRAEKDYRLAQKLDPNDPTAWLYLALLEEQENRVNEAVRDLERSQQLNDNRSLFRSQFLLDEDRAIRSANLARIYADAGMFDWSLREAGRAISYDYANYSAHQFLANSYDSLRDPRLINLRYDAAAVSEYFIANLLAPVGGTPLSPTVSQQEYARMFDRNHVGVASSTEYFSTGDWIQRGAQYGVMGNTEWSLDANYITSPGVRANNDFETTILQARLKQQLTPQDSVYLEVQRVDTASGDVAQYYSQHHSKNPAVSSPSRTLDVRETQEPNVLLGYHHEWSPGNHTLFLAGRFEDDFALNDPARQMLFFRRTGADVTRVGVVTDAVRYRSDLEGYSGELQQIFTFGQHTLVAGALAQYASVDTFDSVFAAFQINSKQKIRTHQDRESAYVYDYWRPIKPLQITAGISYDRLNYPRNIDSSPVTDEEETTSQLSPKLGAIWTIRESTHVRAAYTRSLGGVFFDQSYRLEPSQVGGFNQTFRSIAPESAVGLVPGSHFETYSLGVDHRFPTHTYVNVDAELLRSRAGRSVGIISNSVFIPVPDTAGSARQHLEYEERSLTVSVNQLIGNELAVGVRYRLSDVDLESRFPLVSRAANKGAGVNQDVSGLLHQLSLYGIYNLPCGFFAEGEAIWHAQSNHGYAGGLDGDDFWQLNAFVGYRLWHRHAELRIGVLNITDQDYKLNPLNLYSELPRERTFYAGFKFYF